MIDSGKFVAPNLALLLDKSADDLRGHASRQLAVFTALEENGHHDFRVAARRDTDEPAIIFVFVSLSLSLSEFVTHDLGASGFSGKINSLQVRAAGGSNWVHHFGHCVRNRLPTLGIDGNVSDLLIAKRDFFILRRKIIRKRNMRTNQLAVAGDCTDRAR